jgi:hypothetical protein
MTEVNVFTYVHIFKYFYAAVNVIEKILILESDNLNGSGSKTLETLLFCYPDPLHILYVAGFLSVLAILYILVPMRIRVHIKFKWSLLQHA